MASLALALTLSVTGVYTVWKFSQHDEADYAVTHSQLIPAMTYFDANRDAKPLMELNTFVFDPLNPYKCATDWEAITDLGSWRGTDKGCYYEKYWRKGVDCTAT